MTVSITDLNITEDYQDEKTLYEINLNDAMTSIEDYINTYVNKNLEQLALDCFGNANYTFNNDGAASITNTLLEKQNSTDYYFSDIGIGNSADADFADVDATNLSITFTPEFAGYYKVGFNFTVQFYCATGAGDSFVYYVAFRLTDGTNYGQTITLGKSGIRNLVSAQNYFLPVMLESIFNFTTTSSKTIKLQKKVIMSTNTENNYIRSSGSLGSTGNFGQIGMFVEKI